MEAERLRIQREIEELENTLGANAALADVLDGELYLSIHSDYCISLLGLLFQLYKYFVFKLICLNYFFCFVKQGVNMTLIR